MCCLLIRFFRWWQVFSDDFEFLAFLESDGELSDFSLSSDDVVSFFRDELSLSDDCSSDDKSEDESSSDVVFFEKKIVCYILCDWISW